ncbi:hypothetical protein B0H17DRAFT_1069251 [Mycena rosella]|uniref:Uncharacterized protein n=1 Tax=Mycena rosella TaxID=1033263 RepID=A0AAD7GGI9_MYCRO|nr:hypothetical protein B0H17DRAFT_1069251 [Mycena rosella]
MAWHHYEYTGRVRPWDGLIGLVMRPVNLHIVLYCIHSSTFVLHTVPFTCYMATVHLILSWDYLIPQPLTPSSQREHSLGLATSFISRHLVGRDTFEGTWQMAAQDVLAPSWGGSMCFARGEE